MHLLTDIGCLTPPPGEYLLRKKSASDLLPRIILHVLSSSMPEDGLLLDAVVPSARRQVGSFSLAEAELAVGSSVQLQGEERKKKRKQRAG